MRGSSLTSLPGRYFLYILYSSWKGAREGNPPCIRSSTETIPDNSIEKNMGLGKERERKTFEQDKSDSFIVQMG